MVSFETGRWSLISRTTHDWYRLRVTNTVGSCPRVRGDLGGGIRRGRYEHLHPLLRCEVQVGHQNLQKKLTPLLHTNLHLKLGLCPNEEKPPSEHGAKDFGRSYFSRILVMNQNYLIPKDQENKLDSEWGNHLHTWLPWALLHWKSSGRRKKKNPSAG